jgi:hypothetical protein
MVFRYSEPSSGRMKALAFPGKIISEYHEIVCTLSASEMYNESDVFEAYAAIRRGDTVYTDTRTDFTLEVIR